MSRGKKARGRPFAPSTSSRRARAVAEFQSDAIAIEHRPPPRLARVTLYAVFALIATCVIWASVSHIDTIVTAQGKLITTSPNIVVQPLETSVIRQMHVKAGDRVNRGDALATLDPTFSQADLDQLRARSIGFRRHHRPTAGRIGRLRLMSWTIPAMPMTVCSTTFSAAEGASRRADAEFRCPDRFRPGQSEDRGDEEAVAVAATR